MPRSQLRFRRSFGLASLVAVLGVSGTAAAASAQAADTLAGRADLGRTMGDPSAKVWVLMASDFECPFCKRWHDESFAPLVRDYVLTKKVRIAFINFPMGYHINAMPAAEAAMCAAAQGKFWEMHDALFHSQATWMRERDPTATMATLLPKQGIDVDAWTKCVRGGALRDRVLYDQTLMRQRNVTQTPTFFIGTGSAMRMMVGAHPYDSLRKLIELELRPTRPGGGR
jgi:protein-disulfide isomerase